MTLPVVQWTLDEAKRQRKSLKSISRTAGLDKDTMYKWAEGRTVSLHSLISVIKVLGYELTPLPSHAPMELIKE